ncbi:unnamed protein product [Cochlearia groenlandica]
MEIRYWRRWRRLGYQRLDHDNYDEDGLSKNPKSGTDQRNVKRVKLDPTRKRRFWRRIKKLRIIMIKRPPKKLLTWLRDAYVNMMVRLANSRVMGYSYGGYGQYQYEYGTREYDDKKLVEIYNSILLAQGNPKLSCHPSLVISPAPYLN